MKVEAATLVSFKSKITKPCKKLFTILNFKIRKPFFLKLRCLRPRTTHKPTTPNSTPKAPRTSALRSLLRKMDRLRSLRGGSDSAREKLLLPSPMARKAAMTMEVEDACRSFENYLTEMIVEEGKVRDLMDVEELLYCWKNLKCPVFVDLVSRFYGELCKDLFSAENYGVSTPKLIN